MIAKENKLNKKSILKCCIFIVLISVLSFLLKYAWAKYTSMTESYGNADTAKWIFKVKGNGTNLKFYLKNCNTNEKIFLETENNHLKTKGFIALNDTKVRTERVYWIWELETGNDANEIRINDQLDSACMGQPMQMQISVTGMQSLGSGGVAILDGTISKYDFSEISWYNINNGVLSGINVNNPSAFSHNVSYGENYLEFNGTNSWVNLGELNSATQTIEGTFSIDELYESSQFILGNWQDGGGGFYLHSDGYIRGDFYTGYRIDNVLKSREQIVPKNIYHVAITYDGAKIILYINGIEQKRAEIIGSIYHPKNGTVMAIGTNPNGKNATDSTFFCGKIYSAAIYNRALTSEEIFKNAQIALNAVNTN